jgi:excisionase family DNA binding protein
MATHDFPEGYPSDDGDGLLTLTEASRLLRVHPNTLRRWSKDGVLLTFRLGPRGDRRFRREDLDALLDPGS